MSNVSEKTPVPPKRVGIAADHGGFKLKERLKNKLNESGYEVVDYGAKALKLDDDYPDFVIPLARAVASGGVVRGIAVCYSGVGACIAANKIPGARACLIHEKYSARQGVEDDNMNLICLGGRGASLKSAWELVKLFLDAEFIGTKRFRRRLDKIAELEKVKNCV